MYGLVKKEKGRFPPFLGIGHVMGTRATRKLNHFILSILIIINAFSHFAFSELAGFLPFGLLSRLVYVKRILYHSHIASIFG